MNRIINWITENKTASIGIGIGVVVVGIVVCLFVAFYEPPLKVGNIKDVQETVDRVTYDQREESIYHNVTRYRTVTKYRTDSKGNRSSYQDTESYTDRVFDHHEYVIYREFNGADYVVVIEAPSEKNHQKMRTATFYVTKDRYDSVRSLKGSAFMYTPELGDKRYDFNNTSQEVDRKWYTRFDLIQWMASHNVQNTP